MIHNLKIEATPRQAKRNMIKILELIAEFKHETPEILFTAVEVFRNADKNAKMEDIMNEIGTYTELSQSTIRRNIDTVTVLLPKEGVIKKWLERI